MDTQFGTAIGSGEDSHTVGEQTATDALREMETERVDFCQVFVSPAYEYEAVLAGIRSVIGDEAELIGCSSSGEFSNDGVQDGSVSIALVTSDSLQFFTSMATGLSEDVEATIREAGSDLPMQVEGYPYLSGINLHDGLAGVGEEIALHTQRILGQHVSFAGGSAGDDLQMDATHVFQNGKVAQDAVGLALIASKEPTAITVDHGHEPISEAVEVTESNGPVVHELDGRPAFEVWKEAIADHAAEHFDIDIDEADDDTLLADLTTRYEFGIDQGQGRYKIRWPGLDVPDEESGHLRFAVNIPEGTIFRITASPKDEQIECVRRAVRDAKAEIPDTDVAGAFVYECACRKAILEDDFYRAPEALGDELGKPFIGFETYGELCMERGQMTGYHNTTSVVMLLPE